MDLLKIWSENSENFLVDWLLEIHRLSTKFLENIQFNIRMRGQWDANTLMLDQSIEF